MKNLNTYLESASSQGWREVDTDEMIAAMGGKRMGEFTEGEVAAVVRAIHKACTLARTRVEVTEYRHAWAKLLLGIFNVGASKLSSAWVDPTMPPEQLIRMMSQDRQVPDTANNLYIKHKYQTIDIFRCEDDWFYVRHLSFGGLSTHYVCDQLRGLLDLIGHLIK